VKAIHGMSDLPEPAMPVVVARRQGIYWIATFPRESWTPALVPGVTWCKGQLERGDTTGFEHWQLIFACTKKSSLAAVKRLFAIDGGHFELTRSAAAESYVWKDDTSLGERFELGSKPISRASAHDWDEIRRLATAGELDLIPSDIFIRYYRSLSSIAADHLQPVAAVRRAKCFYGPTGTGKSRRAWEEAGETAFSKDPRSKFWFGYRGQDCVVVDEFRGGIDISHLLRWTDRYPVNVELKGSSRPLQATKFWFTSNIHPCEWYPNLDDQTLGALYRRLEIILIQ